MNHRVTLIILVGFRRHSGGSVEGDQTPLELSRQAGACPPAVLRCSLISWEGCLGVGLNPDEHLRRDDYLSLRYPRKRMWTVMVGCSGVLVEHWLLTRAAVVQRQNTRSCSCSYC